MSSTVYLYFAMFLKNKNTNVLKQIWYFPYFRLAFVFHFVDWASWGPGREKREGTEYAASLSSGMASLHDR